MNALTEQSRLRSTVSSTVSSAGPTARLRRPRLVISVGCPAGIGPEVSLLGARAFRGRMAPEFILVSDFASLVYVCNMHAIDVGILFAMKSGNEVIPRGKIGVVSPLNVLTEKDRKLPTRAAGRAQLAYIDCALSLVRAGHCDALVTGPVSKDAVVRGGLRSFRGHTEYLQEQLKAREVVMAFSSDALTTALVTTHLPIANVPKAITPAAVAKACYWLAVHVREIHGNEHAPRIAVCGLNPHAGEGGLIGTDEVRIVAGMKLAQKRLVRAGCRATLVGPVPAESAFRLTVQKQFEGVVAMYHDQATIPMKLASFGEAVNISLGLPIIRTSVDHGTAYDRAWTGTADSSGMQAAIKLAAALVRSRRVDN